MRNINKARLIFPRVSSSNDFAAVAGKTIDKTLIIPINCRSSLGLNQMKKFKFNNAHKYSGSSGRASGGAVIVMSQVFFWGFFKRTSGVFIARN